MSVLRSACALGVLGVLMGLAGSTATGQELPDGGFEERVEGSARSVLATDLPASRSAPVARAATPP